MERRNIFVEIWPMRVRSISNAPTSKGFGGHGFPVADTKVYQYNLFPHNATKFMACAILNRLSPCQRISSISLTRGLGRSINEIIHDPEGLMTIGVLHRRFFCCQFAQQLPRLGICRFLSASFSLYSTYACRLSQSPHRRSSSVSSLSHSTSPISLPILIF